MLTIRLTVQVRIADLQVDSGEAWRVFFFRSLDLVGHLSGVDP
jgi:hypothetical protein